MNRIDALKQIMHMHKRGLSKKAGLILAFVAVLAALGCGVMLGQYGVLGNGNTPTETTTAYVRQAGNGGNISVTTILDDERKARLVYVTQSGEKYHNFDCQYVKYNKSITELSLSKALEIGYESCNVCRPD